MTYLSAYKTGNLVLPTELLFHFHEIFDNSDDFLVWQFFYLQNTTSLEEISPNRIAESIGKSVTEVNRSMSNLTEKGLLQYKTIVLNGEIEAVFDALPALERLDEIVESHSTVVQPISQNNLKDLVETFQRELGRLLTPFEIEDLTKTIQDDKTSPELVTAALREAVFNGKANWKYIQAILRNWRREGITTVSQVEAKREERETTNPQNITVSDDFLNAMDLWRD
ncbi:DnaD domain-containing protein [Streptococcus constellatus subsp. pharyngis]|uniref:DNA replication protein DnaD n=4 Tax=Streptococcus TaxID=1301 RepID=A0A0C1K656_STRCV|nr:MULTISPECIES: DnaD domain-containing protein [Streptococcus]AGU72511.1 putative DNA replication protein [Streptococcus constellatus subsp. pharyngis C232]AGU74267.1 putative DNA replication protein [Streptococcus constellatus subsp. pharyngis C818]AGU79635.1 putative DNA replication protein [Streptococcus constellatus subsp. pharyngis C1050]EID18900.1 replication initiation and membrane attachment protein, DnaB/DnaD family [Streptococcus constellatus subsp. constellatus SK53]KIC78376.1 DNA 